MLQITERDPDNACTKIPVHLQLLLVVPVTLQGIIDHLYLN